MKQVVLQSDFGWQDGAVSAMEGVILGVDETIRIHHLTHEIPPFDVYTASYRLFQTLQYWPSETVFVSIVDPTVGKGNPSLLGVLNTGQIVITPDNGTLTHLYRYVGFSAIYEIDKEKNLLKSTNHSFTFFGRDLYAYTASRIASKQLGVEKVGPLLDLESIQLIDLPQVKVRQDSIEGQVDIHDIRFGSLWTNIEEDDLIKAGFKQHQRFQIQISYQDKIYYHDEVFFGHSFVDVSIGSPILYLNSLSRLALAINQGNFAKTYQVGFGKGWNFTISALREEE